MGGRVNIGIFLFQTAVHKHHIESEPSLTELFCITKLFFFFFHPEQNLLCSLQSKTINAYGTPGIQPKSLTLSYGTKAVVLLGHFTLKAAE